jgi:hypothetical protein
MSYLSDDFMSKVSQELPMFKLAFTEVNYNGVIPVFVARVQGGEKVLGEHWEKLSNHIAFNFQSCIADEFSVWNLYIFFVTSQTIDSALKYKIENDTFSSRKIVIEEDASIEEIIQEHITNNDINFSFERSDGSIVLKQDAVIGRYVLTTTATKRLTEDHRIALREIIKELKESEHNEI